MNSEAFANQLRKNRSRHYRRSAITVCVTFVVAFYLAQSGHNGWLNAMEIALFLTVIGSSVYAHIVSKRADNMRVDLARLSEASRLGNASIDDYREVFARHKVKVPDGLLEAMAQHARIAPSASTHK